MKTNKFTFFTLMMALCIFFTACNTGAALERPKLDKTLSDTPSAKGAEVIFNAKEDVFEKALSIYSKQNDKKDILAKVKQKFGFENKDGVSSSRYKTYTNEGGNTLKVYDTGAFEYKVRDVEYGNPIPEKEMEAIAEKTLSDLGIDVTPYERGGKDELTQYVGDTETVLQTTLYYKRKIDGYETIGSSKVFVGIANGKMCSFGILSSGIKKDFDIISKSKNEVAEDFINSILHVKYDNETVSGGFVKQFEITKAEIVYLDVYYDNEEQPHVQPCYRLSGTATLDSGVKTPFAAIVPAVPEEYYK